MSWSELYKRDPEGCELKLAKLGTTLNSLVIAGRVDPVLSPELVLLSDRAQVVRVLEYYGDEGHPEPPEHTRRRWLSWGGQLPKLAEPEHRRGHPGGASLKEWPRLALEEATRLWVTGAYDRSQNEIARQVTKKVRAEWDADDLVAHNWVDKPFKFGRPAMDLVVDAIDAQLLEWNAKKGLGVLGKFSATPEWLPIPRANPLPD